MKFIDLFSGIGGFRLGLEQAGHECVGHIEIDKFANQSYAAIHNPREDEFFHDDITTIGEDELQDLKQRGIDIITGGFPCQAFSIAGHRKGFDDTRGTLFFDIARLAKEIQPKYLLLENVKGLLNLDKGNAFEVILRTLDEIGYDAEWQVLNSKHFGVPQNRERVFIIGHLRGRGGRKVFPITSKCQSVDELQGQQVTTNTLTARYNGVGNGSYVVESKQHAQKIKQIGNLIDTDSFGGNPQVGRVYGIDGISPCLNTMGGGGREPKIAIPVLTPDRLEKRQNGRRFKENGEPMFTITAQDRHGVMVKEATKQGVLLAPNNWGHKAGDGTITRKHTETEIHPALQANCGASQATYYKESDVNQDNGFRIRKLTPKECWRLQGFPDWAFERAKAAGVSNSQLYKQAGNSVTVNVVYEIARKL